MKESDITQPVIEKCKEIAKHWRMEIYVGCWICLIQIKRGKKKFNPELVDGKIFWIDKDTRQLYWGSFGEIHKKEYIPIPSISDCLEKLRELEVEPDISIDANGSTYLQYDDPLKMYLYDSCHEALLSALLEVVKK